MKKENCAYRYKSLTHAQNTAQPAKWVPISVFSGATRMKLTVRIIIKSCRRFSIDEKYAHGPDAIISWISLKKMTLRKKYKARAVSLTYQHSLILLPSAWQIGSSLYGRAVFSQSTLSLIFLQVLLKEQYSCGNVFNEFTWSLQDTAWTAKSGNWFCGIGQ